MVAEIEQLIARDKPSPRPPSALVRVLKLLCEGRHYNRAGVFLMVNGREVPRAFGGAQTSAGETRTELSVPIAIGSHTLGSLRVQPAPGHGFSSEERILLHEVTAILALYLSGKGKYLVRKTREALRGAAAPTVSEKASRTLRPRQSEEEALYAAAGEKSRH